MAAQHDRLQRVIRGLSTGVDPGRLLHEVLAGALEASRGTQGLLMGVVDGVAAPLASSGAASPVLLDAAEAAIESGRLSRKTTQRSSGAAAAEPVRVGDRVVGALAVSGEAFSIDLTALPLFGSVAALVMARRPSAPQADPVEVVASLASLYGEPVQASVLVHLFDAVERLFGASAGFCALVEADTIRIVHHRNIDRDRLRDAARHPDFRELLEAPGVRIDDPTHPVVARLSDGLETAVGLPLQAPGRRIGHLVLLVGEAPEAPTRALMSGFARHASLALRHAEMYQGVGDAEERLAAVVHSMPEPVVVVDEDGRFALINGAASEVFQLSEAFAVGQRVDGQLGDAGLENLLTTGAEGESEVRLGVDNAVHRAVVRRVSAPGGRRMGRVLVLQNITVERETEQIQSDFVAVIGHELRTPLTIMKAAATALERGEDAPDSGRGRAVASLTRGVDRLERLVEDLLLVSSVEKHEQTPRREAVDIASLVDARSSERVTIRRPRRIEPIVADEGKVVAVLGHLLDNALKYSEGPVVVEVDDGDTELTVTVVDEGSGIYSGDIPSLFDRFRQLDGSATRAHGGTGLGLYISKRLVEAQGGRIWCESQLEVGSRFGFALPRTHASIVIVGDRDDEIRI